MPGTASQGAPNALGGSDPSSSTGSQPQVNGQNGTDLTVGPHTPALPFQSTNVLPAKPNLPDDPVIPHNGFATVEEGEKAFMHLLRKAGVDANWTWDQTMRAIITDPLYKSLNSLAEKKAAWQKVRPNCVAFLSVHEVLTCAFAVYRRLESKRAGGKRSSIVKATSCCSQYAKREPERVPLHHVWNRR